MIHIINPGRKGDKDSIRLDTRRKREIPNEQRKDDPPHIKRAAAELHESKHPSWTRRSLCAAYNCMGLVFGARRTWIDPDFFSLIAEDDGYVERHDDKDVEVGDVAVYKQNRDVIHVGLIVRIDKDIEKATFRFWVLSKFGVTGEYIHEATDLPEAFSIGGKPSFSVWSEALFA